MTDDEILQALDCEYPFPRDALLAAIANRATIAPRLIAELDRYVADPEDQANRPWRLLFAFYLMGEWREKAAYPSLCRLLRLAYEDIEKVIGDGLTESAHRVLASVFDGDPQPLYDLIHDAEADEFARSCACHALTMVSARGDLPIAEAERFLRDAFDTLRPRDVNYVWSGWQEAVALLGLETLAPKVRQAFDSFIDPSWLTYRHFEEDLRTAVADGRATAKGRSKRWTLFDDTVTELGSWHCFSAAHQRERKRDAVRMERRLDRIARESREGWPQTNPYRHVGRNDLCPCGSGQKFKRCHGKS
ncbi:MAG: DUF1186 domain-containing protein [Alphaproteobacteria bacterium]|nr:DUF1186 domain-containing protein [Alphaproteobacteria bacterium]